MKTCEGAEQYSSTLNAHLDFFSKAGSLFVGRNAFYEEEAVLNSFKAAWETNREIAFKLLLWLRDCRGGAGNRSAYRECLHWLAKNGGKSWIETNIIWLPLVGRWDDLKVLFQTPVKNEAAKLWADALRSKSPLAAKWCDRKNFPVKHALGFKKEGDFRKFLARMRRDHIVEHKMSNAAWMTIDYSTVPSVAMARYSKAFKRHDPERFAAFKERLSSGKSKVNAQVLFPHDCVRTAQHGDHEIADAQFDALPNYLEGTNEKIMVLSDTSGSMCQRVADTVEAMEISQGLALYCSAKIDEDSPFYKKFIGFCDEGNFKDWNGLKFSEAINDRKVFDLAVGSTRIDKALGLILETANFFKLKQDQIPTMLLIVSDMQFSTGASNDGLPVETCMKAFEAAGYKAPKIVYWNTAGVKGSPGTVNSPNTALVSGFDPSILKSILKAENFTPLGIMNQAIEKYAIQVPKAA